MLGILTKEGRRRNVIRWKRMVALEEEGATGYEKERKKKERYDKMEEKEA